MGLLLYFISNCCFGQVDSVNKKIIELDTPKISFETESHDFGTIKKGEVLIYEYKFTNTGNKPLIIATVNTGCDCTSPEWANGSINPGVSSVIKITYKSDEEGGDQSKEISVYSNANTPVKILRFTGYVDFSSFK